MVRSRYAELFAGAAILAMLPSVASAQVMPANASVDGQESDGNQEIIVTASKREERLRDVPAAISTFSGDQLNQIGAQDFRDYSSLVPGLSVRDFGAPGLGTVILRGMNTGAQQTTNTTASYIDDAQFSPSGYLSIGSFFVPNPDLGDVERIEVLKGPQGTLYGANSLGGLVRVISKRPDAAGFSGSLRLEGSATESGDEGYSARGVINIPIISDKLAIRASGSYRSVGGFMDNVGTGKKNVNEAEIYGGRIAVRATPTENLTIDLSAYLQDIKSIGSSNQDNVTDSLSPLYGRYSYSTFSDLESTIKTRLYNATFNFDLGAVSWITTIGYGQLKTNILSDYTNIYIPLVARFVPAGTKGLGNTSPNTNKWTVETRFVSQRIGSFEFIAGGLFTSEDSIYRTTVSLLNPATLQPLPAPFGTLVLGATGSKYKEWSAFGNVTYYLSDRIDVTGGLRFAWNDDVVTTGMPIDGVGASTFFAPRAPATFRSKTSPTTYLATLRWRPTDKISTYIRAASGYRPGGAQTNSNPPVGAQLIILPDSVWNYEAGIKGSFGLLSLEASAYHIDWKDIQLNTLLGGSLLGGNAGAADVDGFELAATARPSPNLSISGSLGYTNARITNISAGASANSGAVVGDNLPLTPKWTAAVLLEQRIPISQSVELNLGGTLRFQSDMPSSFPGDTLNRNVKLPSFETIDLRAGVKFGDYALQLRADNVFNKLGYTTYATNRVISVLPVPSSAAVIRPRTFTLSISAEF